MASVLKDPFHEVLKSVLDGRSFSRNQAATDQQTKALFGFMDLKDVIAILQTVYGKICDLYNFSSGDQYLQTVCIEWFTIPI